MSIKMNEKGQVAIFVIIAIVIVGLIVAFYTLYPKIKSGEIRIPGLGAKETTPADFLRDCIQQDLRDSVNMLSRQGGYSNPEGFVLHNSTKIKYLCYINENFKTCKVQEPFIKSHFEQELSDLIKDRVTGCYTDFKSEYSKNGYTVSPAQLTYNLSIIPGKIEVSANTPITLTKEVSQTYSGIDMGIDSEMYDLLSIAGNIIEFEAYYGDSNTDAYLAYYPNINIYKIRLGDGSTVYTVSNSITKERFDFASRSLVWPPGYGLE